MHVYRLYVKTEDGWEMACSVLASDPQTAMEQAKMLLKPEHRDKPLCLRTDAEGPPPADYVPPSTGT
ncbi:hypothetical protein [Fontivita pretiosa]|uniref:hypothetical protein n=1 Tax=Fontivita pretiosa TaxID=2989684 RepID=UPI003D17B162